MDELKNIEKKIKGYGYDCLCLRYSMARDAQMTYEITQDRKETGGYREDKIRSRAERDKLRFYQILDDLVGEHD